MSNKTKNIITNILGLILFVFNTFEFYFDEFTLLQYLGGLVVALALFLFKATETKEWLRKALSKFSS
tara:strand:- start:601 stop:801 length:201 start_codon:yes stop_codon:yes gene_type:complete